MQLLREKPAGRFSPACLLRPASLVVIGAGSAVGQTLTANLESGNFNGPIVTADDAAAIAALPSAPDLAVFAVAPTAATAAALAGRGIYAGVVVCPSDNVAEVAQRTGLRMLGPESFGIGVPALGLNATLGHLPLPAGRLALISQSEALCRTVLDWAQPNGIGFSHIVGMGGRADLGFGVVLDWLSREPGTGAILLDIRQLRRRRAFVSAARAASRLRPVVAIRAGTLSSDPTGASERAFQAALRRAGVLCVSGLEDLLSAAEILSRTKPLRSESLGIVTNSVGAGQMAADAVVQAGLRVAAQTVQPEGGATGQLAALATAAAAAPGVGGLLVMHAPSGGADAEAIAALAACRPRISVPLLVCAMGETTGSAHRRTLAQAGMAVFSTPEQAVRGFLHLVHDRRNRAAARELPTSAVLAVAPDREAAQAVVAAIRRARRLTSMQDEALAVLSAYGIPVVPNRVVASPADAGPAASLLGFPAVVKLRQCVRPAERHSGGLALDLHDAGEVANAARLLAARPPPETADPLLLVQRQAVRWRELRIKVAEDATFGPIISFGQGGTTADIVGHVSADLPPLNLALAHALIARTHAAATLGQFRDNPPANERAVAEALVRISQLIVDFPEIAELDLNPLIADADGVLAADAWLRLHPDGETGGGLAITPYPLDLVEHWAAADGERLTIRPIRPEDADGHEAFFTRLSPQDIRFRFFTAMREMSAEQIARLTQIDYDREMAFVAVRESGDTVGVARLVCEDENQGEFAVIVQQSMKGKGVATHLMHRLIEWARRRGLATIVGQVLSDNAPMLAFVRRLGFSLRRMPEDPEVVEARLSLE